LLEKNDYNVSSAARAAGVDRSNFRRLLKQYEVGRHRSGAAAGSALEPEDTETPGESLDAGELEA
jgi:transposase-like protein